MKDTSLWCKALEIDTLQTFGLRPCLFFMSIAHLHKIPKGNTTRQWAELIFTTHMWSKGRCKASLQICPANLWFGYTSLAMLTERLCKAQRDNSPQQMIGITTNQLNSTQGVSNCWEREKTSFSELPRIFLGYILMDSGSVGALLVYQKCLVYHKLLARENL